MANKTQFGVAQHTLDIILGVIRDYPQIERAVIFGSRAMGTFRFNSDIDIAIYAPTMTPTDWARFKLDMDGTPIVFGMDIVHYDRCNDINLRRKIDREGIEIYSVKSVGKTK